MRQPARVLPLYWIGALREPSGYSDEARSYLLALERAGYAAHARSIDCLDVKAGLRGDQFEALDRALRRGKPDGEHVAVLHAVPRAGQGLHDDGPTVARTMFETDSIPTSFLERLLEVDEVWVPCEFNVETFRRGGVPADRLHVLPETIDFELFQPGVRPLELEGRRGFTFLTNFDFTDRKGWDILLDAWAAAFSPDDDVCLVLKCLAIHGDVRDIRTRVEHHLGGRETAPIVFCTDLLDAADMPRIYAAADAFVLASRGEGWGRPYMEAMAMGLPTIGSRWSGNLDFMHDGNSWLVDGEVVPVPDTAQKHAGRLYHGHRWFQPDTDALAAAMRAVATGGADVARKAAAAAGELREKFGPEPIAERLVELTEGALERHRERQSRPVACVWRGDWGSGHSLSVVNDGVVSVLEREGEAVRRVLTGAMTIPVEAVGVAGQWPPSFDAPTAGPYVLYQPWEFGRIPARWVDEIRLRVDEVWTPSEYSRRSFVDSGLAPELVHVVPNGVDLERFSPDGPARPLQTDKGTVFLFVGGTIYRKGFDLLLAAYRSAFGARDDVSLVVKSFGGKTFYRGQTREDAIAAFRADPNAPELVLIEDGLAYDDLPALYRAADVLIQPYRGEGFCLPALEALACGLPLVVTAGGPTDEFASDACAWRVPARRIVVPADSVGDGLALAGDGHMLEVEHDALVAALREAADPAARAARAAHARAHAERFSWEDAAAVARERLAALEGRRPIRHVPAADVPDRRGILLTARADWSIPDTWAPALRAYAAAFGPEHDTTLVLPATDEELALSLVTAELADAGFALDGLADIALADPGSVGTDALLLAADVVICRDGDRPVRARRVLPPDPTALQTLLAPR